MALLHSRGHSVATLLQVPSDAAGAADKENEEWPNAEKVSIM